MPDQQTLYNGIRLPSEWPPHISMLSLGPMRPPYLETPPDVIPIDVGRQLFVDDFLIEATDLKRTHHLAECDPDNPILKPDQPWERETMSHSHPSPQALTFSDGVWYDPDDHVWKMWYMGGHGQGRATCYATSEDGIHWEKPELDVVPGTNIVHPAGRDSSTVWLDHEETDPTQRFKLFLTQRREKGWAMAVHFSTDGIHWHEPVTWTGPCGDRSSVFYNPFRKVWVYSIRENFKSELGRVRRYQEHPNVLAGAQWQRDEPTLWVGADKLDPRRPELNLQPQLYNLDAVAYESVLLGLFSIWPGQPTDRAKPNYITVGYSRDGFHWHRPDRRPFIGVSEQPGDWNWGNVQSAGGCCAVVGNELRFYFSGRAGVPGSPSSGVCCTGLAYLRRDGFASMDAGEEEGTLTTRPVSFAGESMFVNVDTTEGELLVEVLDERGTVIPSFGKGSCTPIRSDSTMRAVRWEEANTLSGLAGRPVKFRFHLRRGRVYSFWVSPNNRDGSQGYVAAGGPGFDGPVDTDGLKATLVSAIVKGGNAR